MNLASHCCPTCGAALPTERFSFDAASGILVAFGQAVCLPRREADVLSYLLDRRGKTVPKSVLFQALYTLDDDVEGENVLESHVSKLRRKVEPLGISISSERFKGYTLMVGGAA